LSIKPDILLLDEPTNGLDSDVKLQFLHQLRSIIIEQNVLTIYVTHHKIETELIADEIAYLPNPDDKGIQNVFQSDLLSFTNTPPVLDAVVVFNYPKPNIIKYKIEENKFVPTVDSHEIFYTNIQEENIYFSETIGLPYNVISANSVFTLLEIVEGQYLTINTGKIPNGKSKIYFSGKFAQYNSEFLLQPFFYLEENKII
jgi:ABC-type sulfate/molybdate transport systems ATPase subunit